MMNEIIFVVEESPEGGFLARAVGSSIATEADTFAELREAVRDAVRWHFHDDQRPGLIRLHHIREEVIAA